MYLNIPKKAALAVPKKSRKVLMMMMKVSQLGWIGPAGQEQGWSKAEQSRVKHSRTERGQELERNWGGARNVPNLRA